MIHTDQVFSWQNLIESTVVYVVGVSLWRLGTRIWEAKRVDRPLRGRYTSSRFQPAVSWLDQHFPMPERPGYCWPVPVAKDAPRPPNTVRVVPTMDQRMNDIEPVIAEAEKSTLETRRLIKSVLSSKPKDRDWQAIGQQGVREYARTRQAKSCDWGSFDDEQWVRRYLRERDR